MTKINYQDLSMHEIKRIKKMYALMSKLLMYRSKICKKIVLENIVIETVYN